MPALPTVAGADLPLHLLLPFASSLLYVAAALSLRRATQGSAGVWRSTFVINVVAACCFAPLLFGSSGPGPMPLWQAAVVAGLFFGGQALTMLALNRGDVSVATPVMGTKVVFVAIFVTLLVGDPLPADYWFSAAMSAVGIALVNMGGGSDAQSETGRGPQNRHRVLTVVAALAAAACYALFDAFIRKWSPAWGVSRLLPALMGLAAVLSLALWPAFEGPLTQLPRPARGPLMLGSMFLGAQAILLVRTLGVYPDTTRINIVYNSRGLWSVLFVWLIGPGRAVFAWRMAGTALLLGAIVIAVVRPFTT